MQDVATPHTTERPSRRRGRAFLIALGTALTLAGLAMTGAYAAQQAEGGYFSTSAETFTTPTSALVTDEVLVEVGRPGDAPIDLGELAEVRIRATSAHPARALFVGIGPKGEVEAYLRGVAHDRMASFELDPFTVRFDRVSSGPAPAPAAQPGWVAAASGRGTQTLVWDKEPGAWSAVVMNADGSPGIAIRADVGLRFGFLLPLGAAVLVAGLLLLVGNVLLARSPRTHTPTRSRSHPDSRT